MIYSKAERKKKEELQSLLDIYKKNVDFCGSKEALIEKHSKGYKGLKEDIYKSLNSYIKEAIDGTHICSGTSNDDVLSYWKPHETKIKEAIEEYSSDKVFDIIVEFLSEMMWYFKGYLDLSSITQIK